MMHEGGKLYSCEDFQDAPLWQKEQTARYAGTDRDRHDGKDRSKVVTENGIEIDTYSVS